jgi:acyl-CoA thioesterase I
LESLERLSVIRIRIYASIVAILALLVSNLPARAGAPHLVALGDSLTAGLGLQARDAYPAKLQAALAKAGIDVIIDNAGVSGDTTDGGLSRLDWSVPDGTKAVLLELGANDMLRGMDPKQAQDNLDQILARLKDRNIPVLLLGMHAAPNLGADYQQAFDAIYPDLAAKYQLALYPFFLDGVAGTPRFNQPDGLHPTAAGVDEIVARLTPIVTVFLKGLK